MTARLSCPERPLVTHSASYSDQGFRQLRSYNQTVARVGVDGKIRRHRVTE